MRETLIKAFEYQKSGDFDNAEALYKELLKNDYNSEEVVKLLASLYNSQKKYSDTIGLINEYIAKNYCGYEIYFLLGVAYKNIFEFRKAQKAYERAIELNDKFENGYYNLANLCLFLNEPQNAIGYFKKCIELSPDDIEARYFLSLAYFRLKDYENGLVHFENRLCRKTAIETQLHTYPNLMNKSKLWQGEDISDKTLYTYYEAGFGDMIMFMRYIPELKKRCKKLIIKPQIELTQILKDNFDNVEVMDFFKYENEFEFDFHIPFLSVPYVLGLKNDEMFIGHEGYLKAEPEKVQYFKDKYFNNDKFKIAIKWQGNTYYETDRVINVEAFSPLFNLPDVQVYSAQTFEGSENFEKLASKYNIIDLSADFKDFSYTAGALENIDLVICSDTSLAHLAGALGKPCIVLLPYNYNWRWHTDLTRCDWYDSVKLYRLNVDETWNSLMERIVNSFDW